MQQRARSSSDLHDLFLGPSAENADVFTRLLEQALGEHIAWRRTLHPEGAMRPGSAGPSATEARLSLELSGLLRQLQGSVPFFSPRHLGHMASDVTLPSLIGYIAGLLFNPNNIAVEAGPVTVRLEREAIGALARMFGFTGGQHWGHLTSGGTSANLEALWAARAARYLPVSLRWVADAEGLDAVEVETAGGQRAVLQELGLWELLNVPVPAALTAEAQVRQLLGRGADAEPRMLRHFASELGMRRFSERVTATFGQPLPAEVVLCPATAHYSWEKSCRVVGMGGGSVRFVPVDTSFRMRVDALEGAVRDAVRAGELPLVCAAVIGSTEESAVDPVRQVLETRTRLGAELGAWFWVHADASWGGFAAAALREPEDALAAAPRTGEGGESPAPRAEWPSSAVAEALSALCEVESITVDPHKYGFAPFPAGAVCYRDGRVRFLLTAEAPYAFETAGCAQDSAGHHTLEGSRPGAAAASLWLSQRLLPLDRKGHGRLVAAGAVGAQRLHRLLSEADLGRFRVALLPAPDLNIVCFAVGHPALGSLESTNAFGAQIHRELSAGCGGRPLPPPFVISQTFLREGSYGPAALPVVEALGFSEADYRRAGGVQLLRSAVMHPAHARSDEHLRAFVLHLRAVMEALLETEQPVARHATG